MTADEISLRISEMTHQIEWLSRMVYLGIFLVGVQLAVGMVLFGRIVEILTKAKRLIEVTSKHAKFTDDQKECTAVAVKELREDVKVAAHAAKESASLAASVAVGAVEDSKKQVQEAVQTLVQLDSFRPKLP